MTSQGLIPARNAGLKAHFHSGKFSAERNFCEKWLADTNFPSEKNFEVENFQLLTMIYLATCMWCAPLFKQYIFHRIVIILLKYKIDKLINCKTDYIVCRKLSYYLCFPTEAGSKVNRLFLKSNHFKFVNFSKNPSGNSVI